MGNWSDVEYKLDLAQAAMEDEAVKGKKGTLMMVGSKQCSFRPSGEADEAVTTTVVTDENGKPVTTTASTTTTAVPQPEPQPTPDDGSNNWSGDDGSGWVPDDGGNDWQSDDTGEGYYGDDFNYNEYQNPDNYAEQ